MKKDLYSTVRECIPNGEYFISDLWNEVYYNRDSFESEAVNEFAIELNQRIEALKETLNNLNKANLG